LDLVLPDHIFSAKSLVIILLPAEIYQEKDLTKCHLHEIEHFCNMAHVGFWSKLLIIWEAYCGLPHPKVK
jgi:hypothetical protein